MFGILSIRSKILAMLLLCGVLCLMAASIVAIRSGTHALKTTIFEQLTTLRASKTSQVSAWFKDVADDFSDISQDTPAVEGVAAFAATYHLLGQGAPHGPSPALEEYYKKKVLPSFATLVDAPLAPRAFLPTSPAALHLQEAYVVRNDDPVGNEGRKIVDVKSGPDGTLSPYDEAVSKYRPFFLRAVDTHALEDILLVDAKTGTIVYTVSKRIDLGSNLKFGSLSNSGAARAFRRVMEGGGVPGQTVLEDFSPYIPAGLRPSAFIAAPVLSDGNLIGVLIGVLSVSQINDFMTFDGRWDNVGLGKTGEVYLVGANDLLMRSNSRFLIQNPDGYFKALDATGVDAETLAKIKHFDSPILTQRVDTRASREGQKGLSDTQIVQDYRGISTLSSWAPVSVQGLHWIVVAQEDESEALAPVQELRHSIMVVSAIAAVLLTAFSVLLASGFTRPIHAVLAGVNKLAGGDESVRITVRGRDEFAELAQAFNSMANEIAERTARIDQKTRDYEQLLRNVYPDLIADRIRLGESSFSERVRNVCVVVIIIEGFDGLVGAGHRDTLERINTLVGDIDEACAAGGLEKIRTVGETYIAACGLSTPRLDAAQRGLAFVAQVDAILERLARTYDAPLSARAGVALGDAEVGVVGRHRLLYDVWGPTMLQARRIVFDAEPRTLRVTAAVLQQLSVRDDFVQMPDIVLFDSTRVETWQRNAGFASSAPAA